MEEDVTKQETDSDCFSGETLGTFFRFVFLRSLLLSLYTLDVASDIGVAYGDYMEGNETFGYVTLGFVFSPGIFLALYMICDSFWKYPWNFACWKGLRWLLLCPFLPLWPILRDLKHILLGLKATVLPSQRKAIIKHLKAPSRSYLLKFLEAFTEAAPQLVVRLLKICINNPFPFVGFRKGEIAQACLSLFTLSLTVISTHQKNVSTEQVVNGELESSKEYSLTCIGQIIALVWWITFIFTRIQAIVLFTSGYQYWIFLIIIIHVALMFIIQTIAKAKDRIRKTIIYFFGAFVFIFAYVQFNLTSKVKVGAWVSYIIFTVIVFVENIVMLTCWQYKQNSMTDVFIQSAQNDDNSYTSYYDHSNINYTSHTFIKNSLNDTIAIRSSIQDHSEMLLFVHYGLFAVSLVFMSLTFICPFTNKVPIVQVGDEEEMARFKSDS